MNLVDGRHAASITRVFDACDNDGVISGLGFKKSWLQLVGQVVEQGSEPRQDRCLDDYDACPWVVGLRCATAMRIGSLICGLAGGDRKCKLYRG